MASAMIGNLAVSLTMNTAAFQRGATLAEKRTQQMSGRFAAATTSVKGLGTALGVTLGADVLYRITSSAFEMAASLKEASEQVGVSVEALQELRFAAEQTGVGTDKIEAAIKRLNRSLGDLERGKKSTVAAFAEIGLSADDLRGKRPDEALRLIADALNQLPTAAERVAVGQQLMGRSFSDLLPLINGGSVALEHYAQQSRENGQISDEDAQKLDDLSDSWDRFKTQVGVATANIIADIIPMAQAVTHFLDQTRAFFAGVHDVIVGFGPSVIKSISDTVLGIQHWITDRLGAIFDGAMAKVRQVEQSFKWLYDRVIGHSWIPDLVEGAGAEFSLLADLMARPAEEVSMRVSRTFKDMADQTLGAFSRLTSSIKSGGFLSILEAVIGVGLQLGSIGVFGKGIATRINSPAGTSGYVSPSRSSGAHITVEPSPLFTVAVNGQIQQATPGIVRAGGIAGNMMLAQQQSRRVG